LFLYPLKCPVLNPKSHRRPSKVSFYVILAECEWRLIMKISAFWDLTPRSYQCFGGMGYLYLRDKSEVRRNMLPLTHGQIWRRTFLQNVGNDLSHYTTSHPRREQPYEHNVDEMNACDGGRVLSSLLATCFTLVSCSAYYSTLKMEVACSSEMSVEFQLTTRRYIPEDRTLHNHRCENLKSYMDV
jgi:hypothetical protein